MRGRGATGTAVVPVQVGVLAVLLATLLATAACSDGETLDWARVLPAVAVAADEARRGDVLCADTERSLVQWRGTKVGGSHEGIVRVRGGQLRLQDGRVTGGEVAVDMRTIAVTDIPAHETEAREQLRSHLSHEEFLAVDRFPTARFVITGVQGSEHGLYTVSGNLTIRDSTHNVTFEAAAPVVSSDAVWATADFSIDRQLWGIEFDGRTSALRNALVRDAIQLELTLVASGDACRRVGPEA